MNKRHGCLRCARRQVELKEEYGNAAAGSYALDPPRQGTLGFLGDAGGSGGDSGDPADRGPSTLGLSVEPGQAQVQVVDREAEALQDAGLAGGGGPIGRRTLDRAVRILTGDHLSRYVRISAEHLIPSPLLPGGRRPRGQGSERG